MLALLRSPHLDRSEIRALHLNGFNSGVGLCSLPHCQFRQHNIEINKDRYSQLSPRKSVNFESDVSPSVAGAESVLSRDDKGILMQIMSKCRSLRTLEVAGLKSCVRDEAVRQLGMCPHLKTVDISEANVSFLLFS